MLIASLLPTAPNIKVAVRVVTEDLGEALGEDVNSRVAIIHILHQATFLGDFVEDEIVFADMRERHRFPSNMVRHEDIAALHDGRYTALVAQAAVLPWRLKLASRKDGPAARQGV